MSAVSHVQSVLRHCRDLEFQYLSHGDRNPQSVYTPWMPFQPGEFLSIMSEVVMEARGTRFLDVGCGPGSKLMLANICFALDGDGIEVDREMAQVAGIGYNVYRGDALDFDRYDEYDIIWLYRPFRDPALEATLEDQIMTAMKPGAILAGSNWEMAHAPRWIPVVDDCQLGLVRGAWMKPRL